MRSSVLVLLIALSSIPMCISPQEQTVESTTVLVETTTLAETPTALTTSIRVVFVPENVTPELCEKATTQEGRDSCYIHAAKYLNDSTLCDEVQDSSQRDVYCISRVALQLNNPMLCDKITDDSVRLSCRGRISQ